MLTEEQICKIPVIPKRQDSVADQLADLVLVANKLGMYDAADAIKQFAKKLPDLKYGCSCDLEPGQPSQDDCVLDTGDIDDCIYAKRGMRKEQCENWKII